MHSSAFRYPVSNFAAGLCLSFGEFSLPPRGVYVGRRGFYAGKRGIWRKRVNLAIFSDFRCQVSNFSAGLCVVWVIFPPPAWGLRGGETWVYAVQRGVCGNK